ncbi:threonine/serine exporter family protein [Paraclostridium sordellii]|uniref:threonine/serine exporter family protein n=1 Tax=Paraclostridium sordellii TaxID=1505 RepID=UPI0005E6AC6E|nr:threonine/serine exporter family protein [Paeniclostridium sordellii]CEP82076.1 membrane protein [[Clostridium] sordellii] [Paeniclostridium sordellii]
MSSMPLSLHFVFSFMCTIGFSIFLSAPKRSLPYAGLIGAIGWVLYVYLFRVTNNPILSNFIPATIVGIASEVFARYLKQPAIVFVIPGIIPLVPGLGMYNTMLYLVQENYELAASTGATALLVGGAISLGILLVTSFVKTINTIKFKKAISSFNHVITKKDSNYENNIMTEDVSLDNDDDNDENYENEK